MREKASFEEAMRTLQGVKLIRSATGGALRATDTDKPVELLPTLEIVVPANEIAALADRLSEYQPEEPSEDSEPSEG